MADFTEEHFVSPRLCKVCNEPHLKADHPDVQDFLSELGMPADVQESLARFLRESLDPDTAGTPGRPLKYVTAEQQRAANARRAREYRARKRNENRGL